MTSPLRTDLPRIPASTCCSPHAPFLRFPLHIIPTIAMLSLCRVDTKPRCYTEWRTSVRDQPLPQTCGLLSRSRKLEQIPAVGSGHQDHNKRGDLRFPETVLSRISNNRASSVAGAETSTRSPACWIDITHDHAPNWAPRVPQSMANRCQLPSDCL